MCMSSVKSDQSSLCTVSVACCRHLQHLWRWATHDVDPALRHIHTRRCEAAAGGPI